MSKISMTVCQYCQLWNIFNRLADFFKNSFHRPSLGQLLVLANRKKKSSPFIKDDICLPYCSTYYHSILSCDPACPISHIGWRRTKQSGWGKVILTSAMDIFVFFRHFQWKFLTVSKFSDHIPFQKDGNPRLFEIFWLYWFPFSEDGYHRNF